MSVTTTADEHVDRARGYVLQARAEIGAVLMDREMWGRAELKAGFVKNVFDRLEALMEAIDGQDEEGNERATRVPPP